MVPDHCRRQSGYCHPPPHSFNCIIDHLMDVDVQLGDYDLDNLAWGLRPKQPGLRRRDDAVLMFAGRVTVGALRVQREGNKGWTAHKLAEDQTDAGERRFRFTTHYLCQRPPRVRHVFRIFVLRNLQRPPPHHTCARILNKLCSVRSLNMHLFQQKTKQN